jgi:PIN domain nuclease of toxin-antitoxin system
MTVLLDTCEFLWVISGDRRLPEEVAKTIKAPENTVYLSVVSLWEICIKYSLGKLPLPDAPNVYIPFQRSRHGIAALSLEESAVCRLPFLPAHHKDPFDRMLICQAQAYDMKLVSTIP